MLPTTIALNRFGLGARPGDHPPADGKRWLLQQFDRFEPRPQALAQVPTRAAVHASRRDSKSTRPIRWTTRRSSACAT